MVDLPERKVGIIACSGEEIAEGTVSRLAALEVLHTLKRTETVTICLPLFLAGGEEERTFAKFYPTITIDGCHLKCAAHGTEKHSAKPVASIVVSELAEENGIKGIDGRRCLNEAGHQAVKITAHKVAGVVDQILGNGPRSAADDQSEVKSKATTASGVVTCSCGSGVPVVKLDIDGRTIEVLALPLIMKKLSQDKKPANDSVANELLEMVKIYNEVPADQEATWRKALLLKYSAHCKNEGSR